MTNKRFFTLFISTFFFSLLGLAQVQNRMDRSRFNIGAYHLQPYAATEAHVRDVANCGIDFITCMRNDRKLLDLFAKYHVGAIVNDVVPGWFGGSGKNAGTLKTRNPLKVYETKARRFSDHPAVWGIDIGDEPSALDFPYYGQVYEQVKRLFPHQFPYLNLYPNYASVVTNTDAETISQLGTRTYAEYIDQYCKHVPADYLCYDFYLYTSNKKKVPRAYENLLVVADACTKTNRSMWIVLQANGYTETSWTSENQLRFQAYSAMAFGAETIIWACYTAGWWHNQIVDENGQKTQQYDKVRRVNAELHRLGDAFMKYRRVSTTFVGFDGTDWLNGVGQKSLPSFADAAVSDLRTTDNSPLIVGRMVSRSGNGGEALFVCAADDPYDQAPRRHTVTLKANGHRLKVTSGKGSVKTKKTKQGAYTFEIKSSEGVLIEVE